MIKHQILIIFLCIIVVAWIAYTLNLRRKARENEDDETNGSEENDKQ